MSISLKCRMCGGDLEVIDGGSIAECLFCNSRQTVPNVDDEKQMQLHARAAKLLRACDFEKASVVYEQIVASDPEDAEAHWGAFLCRYGIEYVDDPAGGKVPTCHRSSYDSVLDDDDLDQACENADALARKLYREQAKEIERLREAIVRESEDQEPYDVFICYKETDPTTGERTLDSVMAQDVYNALEAKGYRTFFSRITLEGMLGCDYEPVIFAALNSAKVMLAFGTDYDYYDAVWVKNEWSRFLKLSAKDPKKRLIPCYRDIDPYDLPKEFRGLQGQDLGKVGAVQDLLHGIEKIAGKEFKPAQPLVVQQVVNGGPTTENLIKRAEIALADGDWRGAANFSERALDIDAECARAYLYKFLAPRKACSLDVLAKGVEPLGDDANLRKACRFDEEIRLRAETVTSEIEANIRRAEEDARKAAEARKAKLVNEFSELMDIVASRGAASLPVSISAGNEHTVGLRSDGTVVACGDNGYGQCDVSGWSDIVAVSAAGFLTVGLKADGSAVACGDGVVSECDVSEWSGVVAVSAGWADHAAGLRADGTVVACGGNDDGQCDVSGWSGVVSASAGGFHTVGLSADGTVVPCGKNEEGQCGVSEWRLFDSADQLKDRASLIASRRAGLAEEACKAEEAARQRRLEQQRAWINAGLCQHCGSQLKGLFTKKCVSCGKEKDY